MTNAKRPRMGEQDSAGIRPAAGAYVHRFHALGGPCSVHLYATDVDAAEAAATAAETEVRRIEQKYSRYRDDSIVSQLNRAAGSGRALSVDDETAALLDYAATAHTQSGGLFDITSGVLRRAWDFKARRVPTPAQLNALLPLIGWAKVQWIKPQMALPVAGMEIDFGGFGKEYAADRAASVLSVLGIRHGLVDLSGDIRILGPHPDGSPWQVGVQHPRRAGAIATVPMTQGAIASSGDYERGFERDGQRYCHILDPRSGWSARGLAAVTVCADQCLIAGTASTVAMLLGAEEGPRWLADLGLPHLYVAADDLRVGGSLDAA